MAIYNASLLISASNATYFTNVTGGIAAVAVRSLNDSWISSSALLSGSNTFVGNQIISGNVDINGTITASLQTGYLYVGDGSGRTQAVATSSIITNIATGSFATTGSNTFIGNQIISGNVLPQVDGQGDLGTDTFKWNQVVVNGQLKGSSLNTTGRGAVGTLRVSDETFPLSFLSDREIVGDGTGANTHLYYGTSSADVTALREFVYAQSGSSADFTAVSASFNTRINSVTSSIDTGSFATTGSNVFKGTQFLYSTDGATPLQISSSAYYGIQLQNQGILISGNGGPRIQFPNATWLNGNENDSFQFTGDTDNPLTRGIDFYLYGSGSRPMTFRNNSGTGGGIQFSTSQSAMTFTAGNNIGITAGNQLSLTGSQTYINGLRYPATDGTNGQAIITNGSGILSFGNVSVNTGSFMVTGSVAGNVLTFTKGDASTFSLTVDTGSGGSSVGVITTGSFDSVQSITGSLIISASGTGPRISTALIVSGNVTFPDGGYINGNSGEPLSLQSNTTGIRFNVSSSTSQQIQLNNIGGNIALSGSSTFIQGVDFIPFSSSLDARINAITGSTIAPGTYATLGANTFTGSQTIQSGSILKFNGVSGAGNNGINWNNGDATLYYQSGSSNFLQFVGTNAGIDFSVGSGASANTNINFRTQAASNNVQFTATSGSILFRAPQISIGQSSGTGLGESYLFGLSGSFVIGNSVTTPTYANMSGYSSNQVNGNTNLIIKSNTNNQTTIVSGSANIFVPQTTPSAGFTRYIGGNGNIMLHQGNMMQITSSLAYSPTANSNIINGASTTLSLRTPNTLSGSSVAFNNNIINNIVQIGNAANPANQAVYGVSYTNNINAGTITLQASKAPLTQQVLIQTNTITGNGATLSAASSSIVYISNTGGGITIANNASGSALAVASGSNATYIYSNLFNGAGNQIVTSGSYDPNDTSGYTYLRAAEYSTLLGQGVIVNLSQTPTGSNSLNSVLAAGFGLAITGSNGSSFSGASNGGSAFLGRLNAIDGNKAKSAETIFAVGTGNASTGARKTGFLIDSGSNSYFEGSLNVSGSTSMTGSLAVSSFTTLASVSSSLNFADDTAAAAGGVPLGGLYRNGNFVMIRLT